MAARACRVVRQAMKKMEEYSAYRSAELAEVYDAVYGDFGDIAFWQAMADQATEGPLLELGCGTGRVLLPLARAGREVTGIDAAPHMLERLSAKLQAEPREVRERVSVLEADMTSFDLGSRFAQVICAFGSFHHVRTTEQQLACLERCRSHLLPKGSLVLDLINPDPGPAAASADSAGEGPTGDESTSETIDWTDGRRVRGWVAVVGQHRGMQINDCEATYEIVEADGTTRRLTETFPMRFVFRYELEHLLARCGFRIVALYGDYDFSPFADASLGMIAVAEAVAG